MAQTVAFVAIILCLFYRDPERAVPNDPDAVVSPADGTVIYVRQLAAGESLLAEKNSAIIRLDELRGSEVSREPLWQLGISMDFTDVHINRAPIAGKVVQLLHKPGKFLSLRRSEAVNLNERQTLLIEGAAMPIVLVQIASRLVRQIAAYVKIGEEVALGQRVGIIKFGSQVDVFLPVGKVEKLNVKVGQHVTAGVTIVTRRKVEKPDVKIGEHGVTPVARRKPAA
jgi:phosphatidylserine decarboxylase